MWTRAGRLAVTASHDKTLRPWALDQGLRDPLATLRMPAGPGDVGKVYAVAVAPAVDLVAAGLFGANGIRLYDRDDGWAEAARDTDGGATARHLRLEHADWQNSAFTEMLLRALGEDADADRNGLISSTELTRYVGEHLPQLTGGAQAPGIEVRFNRELFVNDL
jgi:hypothetical protein